MTTLMTSPHAGAVTLVHRGDGEPWRVFLSPTGKFTVTDPDGRPHGTFDTISDAVVSIAT